MRTVRSILLPVVGLSLVAVACVTPETSEAPPEPIEATATLTSLPVATTSNPATAATPPTTTIALPPLPDIGKGTVCDLYSADIGELGTISSASVTEASGIAASRTADAYWIVNDSGSAPVVYAFAPDGTELAAVEVSGVLAFDWEALAMGPGPEPGVSYLYIGDIGDNFRLRNTISLHRFAEPNLDNPPSSVEDAETIRLKYPDSAEDSEAMWVDPITGDIFVVTKRQPDGRAVVFKASADRIGGPEPTEMTAIAEFSFADNVFVTGADVTADGSVLAFRGYNEVWMWLRSDLGYATTLAAEPCMAPSPDEIQGEALTFGRGLTYVTISEGSGKPLNEVTPFGP